MRRAALLLVAAGFAGLPARAAPPLVVGALASDNVEWVAAIPDLSPIGARILGDTMYVTTAQGLRIFDVSSGLPVPLGALELPHYENEDVDTDGRILLMSADHAFGFPNLLYVIDVSNPRAPAPLAVLRVSAAHTASCILSCRYAWLGGSSRGVFVVDLADPANPKEIGSFLLPRSGLAHDVQVDADGVAWVSAGSGLFGYTTEDPLHPTLVAASPPNGVPGAFHNHFIVHNSLHLAGSDLVLVTEENWFTADNQRCADDGRFQTGRIQADPSGVARVTKLADFHVGRGEGGDLDRKAVAAQSCSAHYFDVRSDGVVGIAWYEQGTRFLSVDRATGAITQTGYYMPVVGEAFAVYFHRGYVYVLDTFRGLEILRFNGTATSAAVRAPASRAQPLSRPSAVWGWACRIRAV